MKKEIDMLRGPLWSKIILFAFPIVATNIMQQLFNFCDTAIIGRFGENGALAAVAGSAISMTFEYFAYYVITSIGQTATTFVSQNYAANKIDRCHKITKICLLLSFVSCALITVPLSVFCSGFSGLFTQNADEIRMSCTRIMLILVFEPICTFYEIPAGTLRGIGYSALPAIETIIGTCFLRIVWVFTVFKHFNTLHSLYIVFPITWIVTSVLVLGSFLLLKDNKKKK